jgi:hypothetical protein
VVGGDQLLAAVCTLLDETARSSTATCFCTAAKLISYRVARADTDGVCVSDRAKMSRRVPSAKARNSRLSVSSLSIRCTTIWLYVITSPGRFCKGVFAGLQSCGAERAHDDVSSARSMSSVAYRQGDAEAATQRDYGKAIGRHGADVCAGELANHQLCMRRVVGTRLARTFQCQSVNGQHSHLPRQDQPRQGRATAPAAMGACAEIQPRHVTTIHAVCRTKKPRLSGIAGHPPNSERLERIIPYGNRHAAAALQH